MGARIIGAGSYIPERVITLERVLNALQLDERYWKMAASVGVNERRFYHDFDDATGEAIVSPDERPAELVMAEGAARAALKTADIVAGSLDGLIHVTCTPSRPHFSLPAIGLHHLLGLSESAFALHLNLGCGGLMVAIKVAEKFLRSGDKRILVVASNVPSAHFSRAAYMMRAKEHPHGSWLSLDLFGDGAGALILAESTDDRYGLQASYMGTISRLSGVANAEEILVSHPGGGSHRPASRAALWEQTYYVHGKKVEEEYPPFMMKAFGELMRNERHPFTVSDVSRCYFHPANANLVTALATKLDIPLEKVPMHIREYGNLSAAATPVMFAEDLAAGKVKFGSGELVVFGAIGAGADGGGHVFRL